MWDTPVQFLGQEDPLERDRLPTPIFMGFPGSSDGKESTSKCRRPVFDAWVGKFPWRRAWQPTPVFLPGEYYSHRVDWKAPRGHKELDMTEWLSPAQSQLTYRELSVFILRWPIWGHGNFIQVIKVWLLFLSSHVWR